MSNMGKYCKAYLLSQLCQFPNWVEKPSDKVAPTDKEVKAEERIVYIQENYMVTADIYLDKHILFDDITDEWKSFCQHQLGFSIPNNT